MREWLGYEPQRSSGGLERAKGSKVKSILSIYGLAVAFLIGALAAKDSHKGMLLVAAFLALNLCCIWRMCRAK